MRLAWTEVFSPPSAIHHTVGYGPKAISVLLKPARLTPALR